MTYTYAILEISQAAYDEIAAALRDQYPNQFHEHEGKECIDMHGIAVQANPEKLDRLETILQEMEKMYSEKIFPELSEDEIHRMQSVFKGFIDRASAAMGRDLTALIRRKMKESDE